MTYELIKQVHIACAAATAILFGLRLGLAIGGTDYRQVGPLRWLPHVIDSVLLTAAVLLVWLSAQYPFLQSWLTAKVIALPLYIIAAALALDPGKPVRSRVAGGIAAIVLLAYIISVARTRSVWPFPY